MSLKTIKRKQSHNNVVVNEGKAKEKEKKEYMEDKQYVGVDRRVRKRWSTRANLLLKLVCFTRKCKKIKFMPHTFSLKCRRKTPEIIRL